MCNSSIKEIKSSNSRQIFELFHATNEISIIDPDEKYLKLVDKVSNQIGQKGLSHVDKEILALLFMLNETDKAVLISDDYSMRNIAHAKKIESIGYKTKGGSQFREYLYKCTACFTVNKEPMDECEVCGNISFQRIRKAS